MLLRTHFHYCFLAGAVLLIAEPSSTYRESSAAGALCAVCINGTTRIAIFPVGPSATQAHRVASQPHSMKKLEASKARQGGDQLRPHAKRLSASNMHHKYQINTTLSFTRYGARYRSAQRTSYIYGCD